MKKPELLAPAGNWDSLVAAIEAGCDAVYLSGKLYGARSYAGNFNNEELIKTFKYAHLYGIKVYVTVNTLIYESEIKNFIDYIDFLYSNGVDAIIIQDIGMFDLIRKKFPNLEIHISTQMHVHNLDGAKLMEELGAKRVVLARETPIELVDDIRKKTNIEIEIFIHGALCVSYSGQCLMSSLIGGRSGNRGTCAQCCRQPYDLYCNDKKINTDTYLLSTRDLNTLDNIGKLIDIGIDSLKIEGRLKRPEYVYLVVSTYRKAIDNYIKYKETRITEDDIKELKKIFNRKYTKGFLFNSDNNEIINSYRPNHLGIEIGKVISIKNNNVFLKLTDDLNVQDGIRFIGKKDIGLTIQTLYLNNNRVMSAKNKDIVSIKMKELPNVGDLVVKTTDNNQIINIQNKIKNNMRKVDIKFKIIAHKDKLLTLIVNDGLNIKSVDSDYIVELSNKCPVTKESIKNQLIKTGNTIYNVTDIEYEIDKDVFIPLKILNDLRRKTLDELNKIRVKTIKKVYGEYNIEIKDYPHEKNIVLYLDSNNNSNIDFNKYDEIISEDKINIPNLRLKIPRVQERIKDYKGKLLIGELGSLYKFKNSCNLSTDFSFNVTNSYSVAFLHSLGVEKVTLSYEMNDYQIKKLIDCYHERYNKHPNLELIVNDIPEAMILKYDILNSNYKNNNNYYLKDKYNNKFKVIRKNNLTYIYNYQMIKKDDETHYFDMGINSIRKNSINL